MARNAARLEDVARLAGVSTATVSRCLNTPDRVVEATRKRVLNAVETLGYAPNFNARALAARRTQTIGAIIPTMSNSIFAEGIQAFQEALQAERYSLLIAFSSYDAELEAEGIRNLVARGAEAVLVIGFDRDPDVYRFLESHGVPALVAWAYDPAPEHLCVGFDSEASMADLVDRALSLGHRQVGMISAPQFGNDRARARVSGVRLAMERAGLDSDQLLVEETEYGLQQAGDGFERLLAKSPGITLIVGGNDVLAAGAIRRATDLGYDIPGDVSVVGFDDIPLAALVRPGLTTVRVPHRAMGEAAALTIVRKLRGEIATSQKLATEVCLRDSMAPPRDGAI